jgi:flagellar secretion chaperone FliS
VVDQRIAYRYRDVAVRTANPVQLVVILYDSAIQAIQEAEEHLRRKDIPNRSRSINRALSILSELQASLNFQDGGEIATSLERLYVYMKQQIFKSTVEQNPQPLAEVSRLLDNLRSAWREVSAQLQSFEASQVREAPRQALLSGTTGQPVAGSLNISG